MSKRRMISCVLMSLTALTGCSSTPPVSECVTPPAPPAALMQPPPDLMTPLNGIIFPLETGSKSPKSK
ncbi:putative lipoprotein Rz1 precursor [Cronobacter phage phiES15]|uniref:Rz-like spanin n=1 Tax=Cronobacter phage phiES15 TaxID=1168280 RepID=UPI00026B72EA|nr:Rz-like spanin [Cronobacter phage phiES15]AFH14948.1 putative lipoprotein Rz1 precursor [Cronobacter phage phiES15]